MVERVLKDGVTLEKTKEKGKLLKFLDNIWFYYKWHILIGLLVLVTVTVATVQCMAKTEPDVTVLYVGLKDIGADREAMTAEFGGYFDDVNGDGDKSIRFTFMGTTDTATSTRFQTEMAAGDHLIYIVNDEYYKRLVNSKILAPLSETSGFVQDNAMEDGYGIRLKYLNIGETEGFGSIERNSILCMRGNNGDRVDYEKADKLYKNSLKFFRSLFEYDNGNTHIETNVTLIGAQSMKEETVFAMEYSVYNIIREKDKTLVPLLNYSDYKLSYDKYNQMITDEDIEAAIEQTAQGSKVLLLDKAAYIYLRDKGALASLKDLGIKGDNTEEEYGVCLKNTELGKTPGFAVANKEMYLCGTKNIEGYDKALVKYMREWKE